MALYLNRIIDFDLSKTENKFTVKAGVDPELDRSKNIILVYSTIKKLKSLLVYLYECFSKYL